VFDISVGYLQL